MNSGTVSLRSDNNEWSTEIIGSTSAPQQQHSYHIRDKIQTPLHNKIVTTEDLWKEKLQEIITLSFQTKNLKEKVSMEQRQEIVDIYNRYQSIFSE